MSNLESCVHLDHQSEKKADKKGTFKTCKKNVGPGTVAHAYNPNILVGQGRWITWGQEFKISLANMVKLHFY